MKTAVVAVATITLSGGASAISITTSTDGTALANSLVGSGITIVPGSVNYLGAPSQGGFFSGGMASGIGIEQGIILTTGDATASVGPNVADGTSTTAGTPGDSDLEAIIGATTNDANVLQFKFTTTTGDLFFNYVFASEEYNEYIGSFNDPFALFVDGVNIALAPNGKPVSVGNVNCGNPFSGSGPNCTYFNNNPSGGGPSFDIEYDGFTDVFTAQILGLGAGEHSMKFAIADAKDDAVDSAVFIKAGSFSAQNPSNSVPEPSGLGLLGLGFGLMAAARRRRFSRQA